MNVRNLTGIGILVVLIVAGFMFSRPQGGTPDVPDDPEAREALELVRSHPARNDPTLEDAINRYVKELKAQGTPLHRGKWQVGKERDGVYAVRMLVREKGFNEWIEREFAWRVTLKDKTIRVISLAAIHFMPFHELPPLPHQDQISGTLMESPLEMQPG
ncbi:MAG: hypothetical protein F4201_00845 [Nitrospira sp. SB0677_bin_15]|nr:hypothetical protein [Nitrospira sp. SB0667_bin_9]MYD31177.1 hypothetical protein [Nitrospira sp. SB0661_bin_20]MYG39370.1 hypothetical protein [Nitrospira sp. SB0677_bin_15]MYH03132.1 hypothetical protein [Nitrospira sp. SB0675_bin_23]MYJ23222.1 hypothetical protein [Nitrospira sp. SB0673_bin_12]